MIRALDLSLPDPERRRAARLIGRWRDLHYVPGPGFVSPLEPGLYRSSFILVPATGPAVRASSLVVPAFGGELCRLRLEPLVGYRPENLGSFFEPGRRGAVFTMSADRRTGALRPPARPGWSYAGPSLAGRLGQVTGVRVLRERVVAGAEGSWVADRGLSLTGPDDESCLLLAQPDDSGQAAFATAPGLYRALLDPAAPAVPGATPKELLGYGDWATPIEITIELEDLVPDAGLFLESPRREASLRTGGGRPGTSCGGGSTSA